MNRSGPQQLRPLYAQSNSNRNTPLGSQRLQNGKLGSGSSWGFGMPMGGAGAGAGAAGGPGPGPGPGPGAPGLSNAPARATPLSNFAQAAGGSLSQAPLDLSDFPSLSGGGPQQQPSSVSQAWSSTAALRQAPPPSAPSAPQQAIQRPPQASQQRVVSGQSQASQPQEPNHSLGPGTFDGHAPALSRASSQAQSNNDDPFPPLSNQVSNPMNGTINGLGQLNGDRSPSEAPPQSATTAPQASSITSQIPSLQQAPIAQPSAAQPSDAATQPQSSSSQMSLSDKYGLVGLQRQLTDGTFFPGVELDTLGMNLDSSEPLYPTFSTPFADETSRRIIPEFVLPPAYSVNNVPPLHTRMTALTDDTLFFIFYQYTRDVHQEAAASELYTRDWRWHTRLRQWLMKDVGMPQPVRVGERTERGVYVFFDAMSWRRERREYLLNYDDLDQRHGGAQQAGAAL